jgi:hypothetical protein
MTTVLPTRDILWTAPYLDPDRARYGEAPSAQEFELRVAATPSGSGALIDRITSVSQIVEAFRTGRTIDLLTSAAGWVAEANVTATTEAQQPTGYSGNSLSIQGTGASSTDRGARLTFATPLDLTVFPGGFLLYIHRRITSVTNLTRAVLRFEFATTSDWAEYELAPSGATINTWAEIVVAKGNPRATNGTVAWSNVTAIRVFLDVSGAYTGNVQLRDLRIGTVQTAKGTPDDAFAWETSVDGRVRYRDNATAKTTSTLAASSIAGATNVKYTGGSYAVGDEFTIETAGLVETRTISTVGTSGAGGTGLTLAAALQFAHGSGDAVAVYFWGPWTAWATVKASQPPAVAADTPADRALITDPTPALAHTYSSPAAKAQASRTVDVYRRRGYAQRVLASGPASFWRLGEASGSVIDSAGAVTGTVGGTITRNVAGALSPADGNGAVDLDGSTGFIGLGDNHDFSGTAAMSVGGWINPDVLQTFAAVISKTDGTDGWWLWVDSTGQPGFTRRASAAVQSVAGSAAMIATGAWRHLLVTYDGATSRMYLDGALIASAASAGSMTNIATALTIGGRGGAATNPWNGKLDELAVWSRALDATEVAALAAARLEAPGDDLIRRTSASGTGLTDTLPAFLLQSAQAYAWDKTAADTEGLTGTTARRSFGTLFAVPAAVTDLVATPDPDTGAIELTWTASIDPNLHHYRVFWQDGGGAWLRVDGGPAELDDGRPPLTAPAFTYRGGRLGDNTFQVTAHNGALESDEAQATATLAAASGGGAWMLVDEGDGRYTFPLRVLGAPRVRESTIERFAPPGRGSTLHLSWGIHGRRVSIRFQQRPSTEGDVARLLDELQHTATPVWLKAPAGWLWDPMWVNVVSVTDDPGIGGMLGLTVELEQTER